MSLKKKKGGFQTDCWCESRGFTQPTAPAATMQHFLPVKCQWKVSCMQLLDNSLPCYTMSHFFSGLGCVFPNLYDSSLIQKPKYKLKHLIDEFQQNLFFFFSFMYYDSRIKFRCANTADGRGDLHIWVSLSVLSWSFEHLVCVSAWCLVNDGLPCIRLCPSNYLVTFWVKTRGVGK